MYYTPDFRLVFRKLAATADVVHFHGFRSYQNFAAAIAVHRIRRKYILHPHGSAVRGYGKDILKRVYDYFVGIRQAKSADALIASTRSEALQLRNMGISPGKVHTIPNGVYRTNWTRSLDSPTFFRD